MPIKNLTLGLCMLCGGSALVHGDTYRVRNGDFDWAIAHKHHITVAKLHKLNPGVDWGALKIGIEITVPGDTPEVHPAHLAAQRLSRSRTHIHKVTAGENDWTIAHEAGVTLHGLRELNDGMNLSVLQPGQKIRVPGPSGGSEVAVQRINSTHVAIHGDNVTVRGDASSGADKVCSVDSGTKARVVDRSGSWYELRLPRGTVGWVRGDFLVSVKAAETAHRRRHQSEVVAVHHSNHRHHGHATQVAEGSSTTEYTALDRDSSSADALLQKAQSMRGVRYAWGEASRSGTDCSGFTSQVFRSAGVSLPRTSREQATVGQRVTSEHLRPGDLVFFHTVRGHRVSHVGIYMGHGQFIHASSRGGHVEVSALSGYYANRLVGARRISDRKFSIIAKKGAPQKKSDTSTATVAVETSSTQSSADAPARDK